MSSNCWLDHRPGSAEWARALLPELAGADWAHTPACTELVEWLYTVMRRRAGRTGLPADVRNDIVQNAVASMYQTLCHQRLALAEHTNPAAALERLAAEAVNAARHDHLMRGYGGVKKNGRNCSKAYPHQVTAPDLTESLAAPALVLHFDDKITAATRRVASWVTQNLRLRLSSGALDGITYVLDRLRDGTSRASLVRGGHSCLSRDPAMRFLGFSREDAAAFGSWLLGRSDRHLLGVLDAAVLGLPADELVRTRWQAIAVGCGFAEPLEPPPPPHNAPVPREPDMQRLIA